MEFGDNIMHFKIYNSVKKSSPSSASVHCIDLIHSHTSVHVPSTTSFDATAISHTCTDYDDGTCSICVEIEACLHDSAWDSKLICENCTNSIMCSACTEIENYLHGHVTVSENLIDDSCVTSTRLECTPLISKSTFLSNFIDEQLERHSDIDSMLQALSEIDVLVDFLTCIDCVNGVCSACAEINATIADPSPIPNGVIPFVEEVDCHDEFTVDRFDDHEAYLDVIHGALFDQREVVEHDPIHQLIIEQTVDENPPLKPPDLEEFDLSNILTQDVLVFSDVSGFDAILRPIST